MSLLVMDGVSVNIDPYQGFRATLRDVSMEVDHGEYVVAIGTRSSGRALLARVAAGIEAPSRGTVSFAGVDISSRPALGRGIGWASPASDPTHGITVEAQLLTVAVGHGKKSGAVTTALRFVGATDLASVKMTELDDGERVRFGLARALITQPSLIVALDPISELSPIDRDGVEALFRGLTRNGIAVLAITSEVVVGDRILSLHEDGVLVGDTQPRTAEVIALDRQARC